MSERDSPTIRRFVRTAWIMLAVQLVFAAGAVAIAIWAASAVRHAVEQRDLLQARVAELEARPAPAAPAPAAVEEIESAPAPEPVAEVAPEPRATPVPPVVRTVPPARQPPVRAAPPPYQPPVYTPPPPTYTAPPVYTPPPRVDDKSPVVRDDTPPPRPRRPRINVDVPGLIGGLLNRPRRDPPVRTQPGRNPTAPQANPTRPPSIAVPGRTTTTAPPTRRRAPAPVTQQPPIR
jgi:hypothetical protein